MRKSTIAAAVLIPIIAVASGLATYYGLKYIWTQESGGTGGGTTPEQDNGGATPFFGSAPDVVVTLSVPDAYLGDYPQATFTVTNTGDSCTVSYSIFQTAPQTGSFSLGKGESKAVNVTGLQVRDIGTWSTSVQITAGNSYGSDTAQASSSFEVYVIPFDATPYIDTSELSGIILELKRNAYRVIIGFDSILQAGADGVGLFVDSSSSTVRAIANQLTQRHPNDSELQAKEIYYWVCRWIDYGTDGRSNFSFPAETINDRIGVCMNYAIVLASLYEASGFNAKLVVLYDGPSTRSHAINLLYFPNLAYANYPFDDEFMALDATPQTLKFGEYHPYGYEHYDIADV